jgi:peptidoglycan/LPS O-acetylase OafA/YrhL
LIITFIISRATEMGPYPQYAWWRLLSGLTFTTAFHWITLFPVELNNPLWSIGFEVFCYFLMPIFMVGLFGLSSILRPTNIKRTVHESTRIDAQGTRHVVTRTLTKRTKRITEGNASFAFAYWIGVLILTVIAHGWIVKNMVPDSFERSWEYGNIGGAKVWIPNFNPIGMFTQYCIGVLCAGFIAFQQRKMRHLEPKAQRRVFFDWMAVIAFLFALALLFTLRFSPDYTFSFGVQPYAFPTFAILVAVVLGCTPFSRYFRWIIDNTFTRYTAKISFGLYIWHFIILELMRIFHNPMFHYFGIDDFWHWVMLCSFALMAAYSLASWSYTHIESPFLRNIEHEKKASSSLKKSSVTTA